MVSANTKQKKMWWNGSQGAHTSVVIKFLFGLTTHTGATCNQPVELAKDWKSDCLEKQNLLIVEICGVLGRLHSNQGLAQSNNNAKLKKSVGRRCCRTDLRISPVARSFVFFLLFLFLQGLSFFVVSRDSFFCFFAREQGETIGAGAKHGENAWDTDSDSRPMEQNVGGNVGLRA
jgi:hypothetical protein